MCPIAGLSEEPPEDRDLKGKKRKEYNNEMMLYIVI